MRRSARIIAIIAIQAAVVLVLAEIALRIYNPLPFRVRGGRIVLPVYQRYTFHIDGASKLDPVIHHTKNALGFRGPDPPRDFASRLTIVTIGGSTTECLFLSDGKTWTDALARRLARSRPDVWVNNAGLDGQSSYGHLVLLRDVVAGLHPKIAIFLVGVNDVGLDSGNTFDAALAPSRTAAGTVAAFLADHVELAALAQNLRRMARAREAGFGHSQIDLASRPHLEHDEALATATMAKFDRQIPAYAARISALVDLCLANGIQPVFVTQPALYGDAIDPATGVDLGAIQAVGAANGALWWRVLERYNDAVRRVAAERGVLLVDAARQLAKDSRLYYDLMHVTNEGAERLGDLIASQLEPKLPD